MHRGLLAQYAFASNFWRYPILPYYVRFYELATNKIDKSEYFSTFGGQVPRNYKIAEFIVTSTKKEDKVFIWGDASPIYALSRRFPPIKYVADYHIKDFSNKLNITKEKTAYFIKY